MQLYGYQQLRILERCLLTPNGIGSRFKHSTLKRGKSGDLDKLLSLLCKLGGDSLIRSLVSPPCSVTFGTRSVYRYRRLSRCLCPPLRRNGVCSNHRWISPTLIVARVLHQIEMRLMTANHQSNVREQQSEFLSGRGCIDQTW